MAFEDMHQEFEWVLQCATSFRAAHMLCLIVLPLLAEVSKIKLCRTSVCVC